MPEASVHEILPDVLLCREELARVLASRAFRNAPALSKILSYICNKHLDNPDECITEWSIALDALGRKPEFDPAKDSIVRVEFRLLRKRLTDFYLNEGASHTLRINLMKVGYVPSFILLPPEHKETAPAESDDSAPPVLNAELAPDLPDTPLAIAGTRRKSLRILLLVAIAAAVAFVSLFALDFRTSGTTRPKESSAAAMVPVTSPVEAVRILAGMSSPRYIDSSGRAWTRDEFFGGGVPFSRPDRQIVGTLDQQIFRHGREGEFRYDIPLRSGTYEIHLFFAETEYGQTPLEGAEAQRRFNVAVNGKSALEGLDITDDAGGPNIAIAKVFTGISPAADGQLHLAFTPQIGRPLLNALEIIPAEEAKPLPIRIVCSLHSVFDREGHLWLSDTYFRGGRLNDRIGDFSGSDDPSLYASARFGHFSYSIPVAAGFEYKATLRFVDASNEYVGRRLFNLSCNENPLLTDYDVVKEAGGQNRMHRVSFDRLRPNAQNELVFEFQPVRDYPILRSIELEAR